MNAADVTILIPHYQTLDAIKLCLRALRRYTPPGFKVLVLDNGSRDASLGYLKSLRWIELHETGLTNETWQSHYECLNEAVKSVDTPYFIVMHSDLYVHDPGWLQFLLAKLASGPYAAVGSRHQWIPVHGAWAYLWRLGACFERKGADGIPRLRSLCALFRTDAFRAAGCRFTTTVRHPDITFAPVGQLLAAGQRVLTLPACTLCRYMFHRSATTRIANQAYRKNPARHLAKVMRYRSRPEVVALLGDDTLDA